MSVSTTPTAKSAKKYPSNETINLAQRDGSTRSTRLAVLVGLLLVIFLCGFTKLAILDPLMRAADAEAAAAMDVQLLGDMRAALADYDAVQEEYDNYQLDYNTMGGSLVSATEGVALVEQYLLPACEVETFSVAGDVITVTLSGVTLNQISELYNAMGENEKIEAIEVYTAATDARPESITATMTIFLLTKPADPAAEGGNAS